MALQLEPRVVSMEMVLPRADMRPFSPIVQKGDTTISRTLPRTKNIYFHTKQALWLLFSSFIATLPAGPIAASTGLSLFCAFLGAACVAFAFALGRGLTLLNTRGSKHFSRKNRRKASFYTGLAGAILLSTSAPFWLASTRCSPYPLETLLLLGMSYALFQAIISRNARFLFLFGILFGMNIFEWQVGLFLSPIFLFFAARAMIVGKIDGVDGTFFLLFGAAIGAMFYLFACSLVLDKEVFSTALAFQELSASLSYGMNLLGGGLFENNLLLTSSCLAVLPFLAMTAMAIWQGDGAIMGSFALAAIFSICVLDIPISPWGIANARGSDTLPIASCLFNVAIGAYLIGQSALLTRNRLRKPLYMKVREEEDFDEALFIKRREFSMGRFLLLYLILFGIGSVIWNIPRSNYRNNVFLDRLAADIVEGLDNNTWVLMGNCDLASLLRIHSRLLGKEVTVLDPLEEGSWATFKDAVDAPAKGFQDLPGKDLKFLSGILSPTNITGFVQEWIKRDPGISSKLLVMHPDVITLGGKTAIPSLLGFRAYDKDAPINRDFLTVRHFDFWHDLASLPRFGRHAPDWLKEEHDTIRGQLSSIGKYLAKSLQENGQVEEARAILGKIAPFAEDRSSRNTTQTK